MNRKTVIVIFIVGFLFFYLYKIIAMPTLPNLKSDLSTRGSTNKNPLNIKKGGNADWNGTLNYDQYGHAVFSNIKFGLRAALVDIRGKINRGINTVDKIVRIWATANTGNYSNYIVNNSSLTHNGKLKFDKSTMRKLTYYMAIWESKYYISDSEFEESWSII